MSRNLDETDIENITALLSQERLASLLKLTGSNRTSIELHQETLQLNASLMNVIATIELSLRNAVCENLTAYFGTPGWLTHPPAPFQWRRTENDNAQKALDSARRAEYSKMNQAEKAALDTRAFPNGRPANTSHLSRAKKRRNQITVSDGKIVAEVTFYFWKRLYSPDYEQTLWRPTLKRTFPDKSLKRAHVAAQLEYIYQARNRLAHHEPVLHKRFEETIPAIEFVCKNLNNTNSNIDTSLSKLIANDLGQVKEKAQKLHAKLNLFRTQRPKPDR